MLISSARGVRVCFASATITALALAAGTALVFGPQVWIDFIAKGLPTNNLVLATGAHRDAVLSDHFS